MTILKNSSNDVPITEENLRAFVNQYSPEVVQGYMLAMTDIFAQIEVAAFKIPGRIVNSDGLAVRKLLELHHEKFLLLKGFTDLGIVSPKEDDSPKP